jgi:hypothetical protein
LSADAYNLSPGRTDMRAIRGGIRSTRQKSSLERYMGNADTGSNEPDAVEPSGENRLRGNSLDGSEQKRAADHTAYEKKRNPDAVVRLDGEEDTLYEDGLDVDESAPALIITPGNDSTR